MAKKGITITNLSEFNTALKKVLKDNEDIQAKILTKVSMDGLRELQRTTPYQTGRARGGWNNTVDVTPSDWKPISGLTYYGLTQFKDSARIRFNSVINLSNNVEYIIPLENGHSKQNKHMVNKMFARLTAQLKSLTRRESTRRVR